MLARKSQRLLPHTHPTQHLLTKPLLLQLALDSLGFRLARIIRTPAVVKVSDLGTVELGLLEPLVDNVVRVAEPAGRGVAAGHLRRVFGQQLAEVLGAFAARVEAREERDEGLEGELVLFGGFFGVARDHGVEEFPGGVTKFRSVWRRSFSR